MADIEILEKRWAELASKPKTKEEIEETLLLAKQIELERAKEYQGLIDELADIDIKIFFLATGGHYIHLILFIRFTDINGRITLYK